MMDGQIYHTFAQSELFGSSSRGFHAFISLMLRLDANRKLKVLTDLKTYQAASRLNIKHIVYDTMLILRLT